MGELGSVQMNKRIFKNQTSESGDVPFYKIGTFGKKADAYISNSLYQDYKEKYPYPNKGDLLISASGSIGRIVEYKGQKAYYQDSNIVWLEHNNHVLNSFLKAFYQIVKWDGTEGSTIKRLYNKNILNTKIKLPKVKEQKVLGTLISTVDLLISLQQRKLKQLNLLQRYIKEKTLPSQKELPKLRFLTTPYNTYKFSELFKKSTKKNDGQILQNHVISVASMRWGKLPKSSSEAYMKTYFIFNKGDIAYEGNRSKSYSFGRFVANDLGNGIVSHVFSVFNSKINFNLEFLKNYINSEQVMRDPLRMSTSRTTMMTNLVLKDIAKQTLMIPSKDEQDLLGSLYKITQSMIELNEKQQQELIYLKKYLLQKLFI